MNMRPEAMRSFVSEVASHQDEENPLADMDIWELRAAQKNLKEIQRFIRLAIAQQRGMISGDNYLSNY
jgi:hypothetical protein